MRNFSIQVGASNYQIDTEVFALVASEHMEKHQCRPESVILTTQSHDLEQIVLSYLELYGFDVTHPNAVETVCKCTESLKNHREFAQFFLTIPVDDSRWSDTFFPELQHQLKADFAVHFPQYHNMIYAGLLDHEIEVWAMDRLVAAGLPAILHRLPFDKQRKLVNESDLFKTKSSESMKTFYVAMVERSKDQIDSNGNKAVQI